MSQSTLQIGFAKADITPSEDCPLIGYTQRIDLHEGTGNDGVLDPLYVRVTLIDDGTQRAALLSLDLAIIEDAAADALRSQIAKQIGSETKNVIVAATHTHSGPYPWASEWAEAPHEPVPELLHSEPSTEYWRKLQATARTTVDEALTNLASARFRHHTSSLGFAYTRRVKTPDGIQMCWNPKETPELPIKAADDPSLSVLEINRAKDSVLLFNIAGHPVVLGKHSNVVSADWPGAAHRQLEDTLPNTHACFFHGAGADAHPWLATDNRPQDLDTVAVPVAGLVSLLKQSGGQDFEDNRFASKEAVFTIKNREVRFTVWRLGPVRILAFPGELFGISGHWLRERIDGPLIISTTTNGWCGYWPPIEAFDDGGYEIDAVIDFGINRGDTERILAYAEQLLNEI